VGVRDKGEREGEGDGMIDTQREKKHAYRQDVRGEKGRQTDEQIRDANRTKYRERQVDICGREEETGKGRETEKER
jgi:hypothetical protein